MYTPFRPTAPALLRDAHDASGGLGDLPEWDLSDLYAGEDAKELKRDMDWLETACADFAKDYEGNMAGLGADGMLDCVLRYEKIDLIAGRIMSFAGLRYYQNTTDSERAQFMANAQDKITAYTTPLVFFSLELNRIDDAVLDGWLNENADLGRYKPVFERLRAMKPYQLSDELEKFLHDQSTVGSAAWNRLFDESIAGLTFEIDGDEMNIESTLNLLTDPDRDQREKGARELASVFGKRQTLLPRAQHIGEGERDRRPLARQPTPQTGRHLSNHVEPEVVEALRNAVVAAYPKLSHPTTS